MTTEATKPAATGTKITVLQEVRNTLVAMGDQFKMALPSHISPEKFQRVAVTALQTNPSLLDADRRSLLGACMKAAQDGLLPDGREAALVVFNTKTDDGWIKQVQYMPMIAGILKKARNSGEIAAIDSQVVYEADEFLYVLGDDAKITHKPNILAKDRGKPIAVYAIATLTSGEKMREVMSIAQVNQVREVSKSKDKGPWVQWWDEMARKVVTRRLAKRLPSSSDRAEELHNTLHADDDFYTAQPAPTGEPAGNVEELPAQTGGRRRSRRLDAVADAPPPANATAQTGQTGQTVIDAETGEVTINEEMPPIPENLRREPPATKSGDDLI